jgi:hypothetical protein
MTGVINLEAYSGFVPRIAEAIRLELSERLELERWVAAHGTPQQVTQRCRIILAGADGRQDQQIAEDLAVNFKTAALWRGRFRKEGVDASGKWLRGVDAKRLIPCRRSRPSSKKPSKAGPPVRRIGVVVRWPRLRA